MKFAVYLDKRNGHIKFGGYDSHAFMSGIRQLTFDLDLLDMSVAFSKFKIDGSIV